MGYLAFITFNGRARRGRAFLAVSGIPHLASTVLNGLRRMAVFMWRKLRIPKVASLRNRFPGDGNRCQAAIGSITFMAAARKSLGGIAKRVDPALQRAA